MEGGDQMPKADLFKEKKVDASTQEWMKHIERKNLERVQKLKLTRKWNIFTGCLLGSAVLGIYTYSILSVKQETFLDDFEEPKLMLSQEENKLR